MTRFACALFAILFVAAPFVVSPAVACPMQDAQAYQQAAEKVDASDGTKVVLSVVGLTCGSCSDKLTKELTALAGVNAAAVDYQTGEARIAYVEGKTDVDALIKAIEAAGFTATVNTAT